jgi:hypothetical protein
MSRIEQSDPIAVELMTSLASMIDEQHQATWVRGFVAALAEMHRATNDDTAARSVARAASVTLVIARAAKCANFDLARLELAGIP